MALNRNRLARLIGVSLMGHTHLLVANYHIFGLLLPTTLSNEVLCLKSRIAHKLRVRGHSDEVFRWHVLPELVQDGSVVDLAKSYNGQSKSITVDAIYGPLTMSDGATQSRSRCQSFASKLSAHSKSTLWQFMTSARCQWEDLIN